MALRRTLRNAVSRSRPLPTVAEVAMMPFTLVRLRVVPLALAVLLVASAAATARDGAPPPASGAALPTLDDEFGGADLAGWDVMQGDIRKGGPARYDVGRSTPGALTVRSATAWWVSDSHAFYASRQLS